MTTKSERAIELAQVIKDSKIELNSILFDLCEILSNGNKSIYVPETKSEDIGLCNGYIYFKLVKKLWKDQYSILYSDCEQWFLIGRSTTLGYTTEQLIASTEIRESKFPNIHPSRLAKICQFLESLTNQQ